MNNQSDTSEKKIFEALSKDVLNGLSIDLVSIWYFTNDNMNLTCQYSIDRFNKHNLTNIELLRSDFPNYFSSVIEDGSISAENVYSHPNTKELTETYFEPYNVKSLLDYIIYMRPLRKA
ncbi:MAG: hypothetical protein P8I94_01580 [Emcibacteraceae bacterium]|nr:hypothetical protein [Emcibacteraceae bacterium]